MRIVNTKTGMTLLGVLTLFFLAGVVPSPGGMQAAVFRSPVFAILLGFLAIGILVRSTRNWRRPDFLLAHLGIVAILTGALLALVWSVQGTIVASVGETQPTRDAQGENGSSAIPLGFGMTVPEFHIEYFDPFADGRALRRTQRTVSDYRAILELTEESGVTKRAELRVNHPVAFQGWRFHLMSCDEGGTVAHISARRDPGRMAVISGIWAVLLGVAAMCWRPSTPKEARHVA